MNQSMPTARKGQSQSWLSRLWRQKQLMLMSVPILLYVLLFNYAPMWGWITAFMKYNPKNKHLFDNAWVGLDNFKWLFNRPEWLGVQRNTIAMSLINLVFGTLAAVLLAVLLNEVRQKMFKRTVQTVTYLPHFLSLVIVVSMAQNIFASDGPVNQLLLSLHIIKEPVFWLGEGKYFWWLVGFINVWKEVGWNSIIYISTMTSIDPSLYEAASIDGAGRWKKMWYITMPSLANTIITVLILNLAKIMNLFESVFVLQNDAVRRYTHVLQTYVYQQTFAVTNPNYGYTTAVGLFRSMVGMALFLICNYASKKVRGRGIV